MQPIIVFRKISCSLFGAMAVLASPLLAGINVWTTNGPYGVDVQCVAVAPSNSSTIYAGTADNGVYKTTDGGLSWEAVNNGLVRLVIFDIAIDPVEPLKVYVGTYDGVFKSLDGGENWKAINAGLTDLVVFSISIDPSNPSVLYAGTHSDGIFKTSDGGNNWHSTGMQDQSIADIVVAPSDTSVLYALLANGPGPIGIAKSTDGGGIWVYLENGTEFRCATRSIAVDPKDPNTIYAGTWKPPDLPFGCGLMKSTDGGNSWSSIPISDYWVGSILINPVVPMEIYVSTGYEGVVRSTNNGVTWKSVNAGLTYPAGVFDISISDPSTVYAIQGYMEGVWSITFSKHRRPISPP